MCILNRMRLGKLFKIASRPNWEKPEEAGSWGGGQELKGISRLQFFCNLGMGVGVTVVRKAQKT